MELGKVDHQPRQKRLTGALRRGSQAPGQAEGDGRVVLPDLDGCRQAQHVVDGGLHQADSAGDARADDVRARLGVAAVALGVKAGDPVVLHAESDRRHALDGDLADRDLGVRLTMTLTLAVTLLGVVLEDADFLALAVLDDLGLHGSALHHGGAEGGLLAVDDGQDLVELDGVAGFLVQLLDVDHVALSDLVLLAAGHDDCVHLCFNSFIYGLAVGGGAQGAL